MSTSNAGVLDNHINFHLKVPMCSDLLKHQVVNYPRMRFYTTLALMLDATIEDSEL